LPKVAELTAETAEFYVEKAPPLAAGFFTAITAASLAEGTPVR